MRGACARALVAHGMLPSLGLFHSSEQNAFNLADDLIEPYRSIVDLHVAQQPERSDDAEQSVAMVVAQWRARLATRPGLDSCPAAVSSTICWPGRGTR